MLTKLFPQKLKKLLNKDSVKYLSYKVYKCYSYNRFLYLATL